MNSAWTLSSHSNRTKVTSFNRKRAPAYTRPTLRLDTPIFFHIRHRSPSSNLSYLNPHRSPNPHLRLHTSIFLHIQPCLHTTVVYGTHNGPTSEPTKSIHQLPHWPPSFNLSLFQLRPHFLRAHNTLTPSRETTLPLSFLLSTYRVGSRSYRFGSHKFLLSTYRFSSQVAPLNMSFSFPICTSRHGPGGNRYPTVTKLPPGTSPSKITPLSTLHCNLFCDLCNIWPALPQTPLLHFVRKNNFA